MQADYQLWEVNEYDPRYISDAISKKVMRFTDERFATINNYFKNMQDGVLIITKPIDRISVFLILHHKSMSKVKDIRFSGWHKISVSKTKRAYKPQHLSFKKTYGMALPEHLYELLTFYEATHALFGLQTQAPLALPFYSEVSLGGFEKLSGVFEQAVTSASIDVNARREANHPLNFFVAHEPRDSDDDSIFYGINVTTGKFDEFTYLVASSLTGIRSAGMWQMLRWLSFVDFYYNDSIPKSIPSYSSSEQLEILNLIDGGGHDYVNPNEQTDTVRFFEEYYHMFLSYLVTGFLNHFSIQRQSLEVVETWLDMPNIEKIAQSGSKDISQQGWQALTAFNDFSAFTKKFNNLPVDVISAIGTPSVDSLCSLIERLIKQKEYAKAFYIIQLMRTESPTGNMQKALKYVSQFPKKHMPKLLAESVTQYTVSTAKPIIELPQLKTFGQRFQYLISIGLAYGPIGLYEDSYEKIFQSEFTVNDKTLSDLDIIGQAIKSNNAIHERLEYIREIDRNTSEAEWLQEFDETITEEWPDWHYIDPKNKTIGAYKKGIDANILIDINAFQKALECDFSENSRSKSDLTYMEPMEGFRQLFFAIKSNSIDAEDNAIKLFEQKGITETTLGILNQQVYMWLFSGYSVSWYEISSSHTYIALGKFDGYGALVLSNNGSNSKECLFFSIHNDD